MSGVVTAGQSSAMLKGYPGHHANGAPISNGQLHTTIPPQLKQEPQETDDPTANNKEESQPEVDIVINNVVCSFSVRCHLNLKEIALNGSNVEYRRENGMVTMKLRYRDFG